MPERHSICREQRGQIVVGQVQTLSQSAAVFGLKIDQTMRDMILVEKIIKLAAIPRILECKNSQPSKFPVTHDSFPAHDESLHDRFADPRQLGERLAKPIR